MNAWKLSSALVVTALIVTGCSDAAENGEPERAVPVTAVEVSVGDVEVTEDTVGRIEAATAPTVAAEIPGRIVAVLKDAGDTVAEGETLARIDPTNYRNAVQRLEALHGQQARTVRRFRDLVANQSASQNQLDEAEAQLSSLAAQLSDARTALERTTVVAPVAGVIQRRFVSVGDFRGVGDPLFEMAALSRLRVTLPFPERVGDRLAVGQTVRLTVASGTATVNSSITELRPMVGTNSRALEAIVELDNPGGWRPGNSVTAKIVLATRPGQAKVPALSVVQRPAGSVVYVIDGERARQRVVEVGVRTNGHVEILSGLQPGERVVVDGAGFLTDGVLLDAMAHGG